MNAVIDTLERGHRENPRMCYAIGDLIMNEEMNKKLTYYHSKKKGDN
jgi:hypothetical protein